MWRSTAPPEEYQYEADPATAWNAMNERGHEPQPLPVRTWSAMPRADVSIVTPAYAGVAVAPSSPTSTDGRVASVTVLGATGFQTVGSSTDEP